MWRMLHAPTRSLSRAVSAMFIYTAKSAMLNLYCVPRRRNVFILCWTDGPIHIRCSRSHTHIQRHLFRVIVRSRCSSVLLWGHISYKYCGATQRSPLVPPRPWLRVF
ncbi:hypothetical protein BJV74DRAFT_827330 [Russula compacta]|nr:hypothetical protein BJV74DRAFT_827330 [Russula compacta]